MRNILTTTLASSIFLVAQASVTICPAEEFSQKVLMAQIDPRTRTPAKGGGNTGPAGFSAPRDTLSLAGQRWDGTKAVVDSYVLQMPVREPHAGQYLVCGPIKPIAGTSMSECFWWDAIELEAPVRHALL